MRGPCSTPPPLGSGAEVEPADAGERDGRRAHGAGLERHVEVAPGEPLARQRWRRRSRMRQQLGVRGRIGGSRVRLPARASTRRRRRPPRPRPAPRRGRRGSRLRPAPSACGSLGARAATSGGFIAFHRQGLETHHARAAPRSTSRPVAKCTRGAGRRAPGGAHAHRQGAGACRACARAARPSAGSKQAASAVNGKVLKHPPVT